jgi:hypothetical protein
MTWVVWRQYRASGAIALALLAALAAVIIADGVQIAARWHSVLAACAGNSACVQQQPALVNGVVSDLPYLCLIVPAVLGMLWGAPLVAHELESRTSDFAWAQSVTRARWLAVKVGWLLLAAAACGGAVAALTTWWSGPINAMTGGAFAPGQPISVPQSTSGAVLGGANGLPGIPVTSLPAQCQAGAGNGPFTPATFHAVVSCAQAHGIRGYVTYQPASRYWAFQGIETGIFLLLAAALLAITFAVILRRDA